MAKDGKLFGSYAIARFVANHNPMSKMWGSYKQDKFIIDSWVGWCSNELDLPASTVVSNIISDAGLHNDVINFAKDDLKQKLRVLEEQLGSCDTGFIAGECLTLADISIACTLVYPFKFVCDKDFRKPFPKVVSWFERCVALPQFKLVLGRLPFARQRSRLLRAPTMLTLIVAGRTTRSLAEW